MDPASKLLSDPHTAYSFNGFTLDVDRAALSYAGENVKLRPQSFDVLRYLVENPARLVTKVELLSTIWGNTAVTDDSLTHCLIDIRKAIGDSSKQMIKTVPRRGFIFDMPVQSAAVPVRLSDVQRYPYSLWKLVASIVIAFGLAFAVMGMADRSVKASLAEASVPVTENIKAQERYLQAWFLFQRRQPGDLGTAREYFQQAIDMAPDYARAWAGLAGVYYLQISAQWQVDGASLEEFGRVAQQAVMLDPDLAEANMRLGNYYWIIDDQKAANRYFQRAVELQPDDPLMLSVFAGRYAAQGRMDEAIEMQTRAIAMEPLSRVNIGNLAYYLFDAGRYVEAQAQFRRVRQIFPELAEEYEATDVFASILLHQYERALAGMELLAAGADKDAAMGMVYHALGREREASQVAESMMLSPDPDTCIRLAELHAFRQNIDDSFIWLEKLREQLDHDLNPVMVNIHLRRVHQSPFLAAVRTDPRWGSWLAETNKILM